MSEQATQRHSLPSSGAARRSAARVGCVVAMCRARRMVPRRERIAAANCVRRREQFLVRELPGELALPFAVTPSALSVCCDSNVTSAFCGRPERPPIPVAFILAVMDVDETVAVRLIGGGTSRALRARRPPSGGRWCTLRGSPRLPEREPESRDSVGRSGRHPVAEEPPPQSWYAALRGVLSRVRDTMELASIPAGSSGRVAATSGCRCPTD